MKNLTYICMLVASVALVSCSTSSNMTAFNDDIYYSPKDEAPVTASVSGREYIDIDDRDYGDDINNAEQKGAEYSDEESTDDYYDPNYKTTRNFDNGRGASTVVNNYYDEDDFYYSSRIRRFHQPSYFNSFNYYDPYFTTYYGARPYYYRPNIWQPYAFNPGWSATFHYGNGWAPGWATSYAYNPWGYNPYAFNGYGYGGYSAYCPPNNFGNGYYNDFYSNGAGNRGVFNGQYTPISGYSTSATPQPRDRALENAGNAGGTRPVSTDSQWRNGQGERPSSGVDSRPRSGNSDARPQVTPREDSRPRVTPRENTRPRATTPKRDTRPRNIQTPKAPRNPAPRASNPSRHSAPARSSSPRSTNTRSTSTKSKSSNRR